MQRDEFDLAALEEGQDPVMGAPSAPAGPLLPDPDAPPGSLEGGPGGAAEPSAGPLPAAPLPAAPLLRGVAAEESPMERGSREGLPDGSGAEVDVATLAAPATPPRDSPPPESTPIWEGPLPAARGLTSAEATDRIARGLANRDDRRERRDRDVIRENAFTYFNMVLFSLIAVLLVLAVVDQDAGHAQDGLFVGIVVAMNVAVGTWQELRATHTLRALQALSAPQATVERDGLEQPIASTDVVQDDLVLLTPGDQVVADGRIVRERAEIDESLLTGESSSVPKEVGDTILSGSFCVAGRCYYVAERVGQEAYAMRLTQDARRLVRRSTPLQVRFKRIVRLLLLATAALGTLLLISSAVRDDDLAEAIKNTTATISSVVPEGLLLGMTVAFAVGAVRLSRRGAIVQDINAVEAMNYLDVVCLDKTGTITANALSLQEVRWASSAGEPLRGWLGAFAAAGREESRTASALADELAGGSNGGQPLQRVPFNSERRWSALTLELEGSQRHFVLGAPETILPYSDDDGGMARAYAEAALAGLRGIVFAEAASLPDPETGLQSLRALALLTVADVLREEVAEAFAQMGELGVEPKIISGDNPETVAALVQQLGIRLKGGRVSGAQLATLSDPAFAQAVEENSVFGRIGPEQKARIVRALREQQHYVAMIGDGANDVRALRAADVAVAMESGTQTARGVAGIILVKDSFAAFVQGTAEAQAVLGNSTQLSKLFITKSFYAFLIIICADLLQLDFPFLPRHGSLTSLFTLGIPTVFIALTKPPRRVGADFTNSVLRFALPASVALAASTVAVHLLTQGFLDRPIEDSRTLVSLTIGIVGIYYMVQVIGYDGVTWDTRGRALMRPMLTTAFGVLLLFVFILTIYASWIRDFFDFVAVDGDEWGIVIPAVIAAMAGQYGISRYWRQIVAWIIKQPDAEELERGRAS